MWNGKPDKIKRVQINQDYLDGGLKMVNSSKFIKSMKCTWVRRLIQSNGPQWIDLFQDTILPVYKLTNFGPNFCKSKINISNSFWKEVFSCWYKLYENTTIYNYNIVTYYIPLYGLTI